MSGIAAGATIAETGPAAGMSGPGGGSQAAAAAWAPGALPMLWWTVFFVALYISMNVVAAVTAPMGHRPPVWMFVLAVAWLIPAGFSHAEYTRAKRAVAADPTLQGRWLVRNLWWVVVLVMLLGPTVVSLATL